MTPSTTDLTFSRTDAPDDLVDFLDLLVDAMFSSIDARSPGLILKFGPDKEDPK
jgi:hypothetical protein